jgi:hypothetical protein
MSLEDDIALDLTRFGFQYTCEQECGHPIIIGKRKDDTYEYTVRVEFYPFPRATLTGKNGCSLKYMTSNLSRLMCAVKSLDGGKKFSGLWEDLTDRSEKKRLS